MNKANLGGALVLLGVLCSAGHAHAAPRTHDGFQFRGTVGGGYLSDSESFSVPPLGDFSGTISGGGAAFELYFGGTPADGLVIGGFVSAMVAAGPKLTVNGVSSTASSDVSLNLATVGPYIDFYPDPTTGFHVLGTLAFAQVSATDSNGNTSDSATSSGFGIGAGLGYDWWVGDEWSLGVLGRFTYAATSHDTAGIKVTDNAVAPALLFSACFQ